MLIENEFVVAEPVDTLWNYLLDVERIAPCMPGAEITKIVDDRTWQGKVNVKFGPIALSFAGTVAIEERDDASHRVKLLAKGTEQKGKGVANATVTSWLEPGDVGATTVKMQADITLTGAVAQLSRGLLPEVSKKLTQEFADCLQARMSAESATVPEGTETAVESEVERLPATSVSAKPVGGVRLGLGAMWTIVKKFVSKLFGRKG